MKNNYVNTAKGFITAVTGCLSSILGVLFVPVLLLIVSNVIDYITGLMAASQRPGGGISSYQSIRGIAKKVSLWLLVIVGAMIDALLKYSADTLGFTMPFRFLVACVVAIWIVCNEIISILENMVDIGIKIPSFLMPLVKSIKAYGENISGTLTKDREE
ncbi:MAG: phage holin family protein [Lachnospiraceae bacterium]|nr:phage holin family protein [Lachnospiraceae bacterium]MDE6980411.1 phage holin family protein [Lachnospiraceae bacterium]